jgi:Ca2+-binding EF-hand superfamily protein
MLFDYNKSGQIFERDIGPVVRSVGLKPSEAEIRSIQADVRQMGK